NNWRSSHSFPLNTFRTNLSRAAHRVDQILNCLLARALRSLQWPSITSSSTSSPEIAEARDATVRAVKDTEQGCQRAIDKIAERASLTKGPATRRNPPWGVYSKSSL